MSAYVMPAEASKSVRYIVVFKFQDMIQVITEDAADWEVMTFDTEAEARAKAEEECGGDPYEIVPINL